MPNCLTKQLYHPAFPPIINKNSYWSTCLLAFSIVSVSPFSNPNKYVVISHYCFDLQFPCDIDVECLSCAYFLSIYLLVSCLFRSFAWILILFCFYCWVLEFFVYSRFLSFIRFDTNLSVSEFILFVHFFQITYMNEMIRVFVFLNTICFT